MSRYEHLFSPLRIGPLTVKNRVVFSAHLTNYAQDGLPSEQHAAYYAARAAGGAGLIITEEHSTHVTDWPYEKLIHGFSPKVVAGYRRITEAVHAHGVPILAQLNHNGGQASSMFSRLPVWAPSAVPDPLFREVPKALETHEIKAVVDGYALVTEHCLARTPPSCAASCPPPPTTAPTRTADRWRTGRGCCSRSSPPCAPSSGPTRRSACGCAATS
jgi:2,4-dienoyl-CoA reductase-like NADH-dependent reductase (Old Yellow Enzyme family)